MKSPRRSKYEGVEIPPMGMVDDIITVSSVEKTANVHKLVNTFVGLPKTNATESTSEKGTKNAQSCQYMNIRWMT